MSIVDLNLDLIPLDNTNTEATTTSILRGTFLGLYTLTDPTKMTLEFEYEGKVLRGNFLTTDLTLDGALLKLGLNSIPDIGKTGLNEVQQQTLKRARIPVEVRLYGTQSIDTRTLKNLANLGDVRVTFSAFQPTESAMEAAARKSSSNNVAQGTPTLEWPKPDDAVIFRPIPLPPVRSDETRIGYAYLQAPINHVQGSRNSQMSSLPSMRQPGTIKKSSGLSYENYTISFIANGMEEINSSVYEILEQFDRMPFLTVEGGPFPLRGDTGPDSAIPHSAIALRSISVTTVDGFPNSLMVSLNFDPFKWDWYTPQSFANNGTDEHLASLDDQICWPLLKAWCKTTNSYAKKIGSSMTGVIKMGFPDPEQSREILNLITADFSGTKFMQDEETIRTFQAMLTGEDTTGTRNVKKIDFGPTTEVDQYFVVKINDPSLYQDLLGKRDYVLGVTDWSKFAGNNYANEKGQLLPASNKFSAINLADDSKTEAISIPANMQELQRQNTTFLTEIENVDTLYSSMALQAYNLESLPVSGTNDYAKYTAKYETIKNNPQEYLGLVFKYNKGQSEVGLDKYLDTKLAAIKQSEDATTSSLTKNRIGYAIDEALATMDPANGWLMNYGEWDIIAERISATKGANLAIFSNRNSPLPLHQYLGGMDTSFVIEGKCFGNEAKNKLVELKDLFDSKSLQRISRKLLTNAEDLDRRSASTFLSIENEIFALFGVRFVVPLHLDFQTIDDQPGVWTFQLSLVEYDPKQKIVEQMRYLPTTLSNMQKVLTFKNDLQTMNPILEKALEWFSLQASLLDEQVYPDMQLPKKWEISKWVDAIRSIASSTDYKTLSKSDLLFLDIVGPEFFQNYDVVEQIKAWPKPPIDSYATSLQFCDPDFYCYYAPEQAFNTFFDSVSKSMMGKNNNGKSGEDQATQAIFRENSSQFGIVTSMPANYYRGNAADYEEMAKKAIDETLPEAQYQKVKKQLDAAETTFLQNPGRWWADTLITTGAEGGTIILPSDMDDAMYLGMAPPNLYTPDLSGKPTALGGDAESAGEVSSDYFKIAWRQELVKSAASLRGKKPYANATDFTSSKVFAFDNENTLRYATSFNTEDGGVSTLPKLRKLILEGTQALLDGDVKKYLEFDKQSVMGAGTIDFTPLSLPHYDQMSYVSRTAMVSDQYRSLGALSSADRAKQSVPLVMSSDNLDNSNLQDRIKLSWKRIDIEAINAHKKYIVNIDPNIIRAVLIARDGMGLYGQQLSAGKGYGDLNQRFYSKNLEEVIVKLTDQYAQSLRIYKRPTTALLHTLLVSTVPGEAFTDQDGKLTAKSAEVLNKAAQKLSNFTFTKNAGDDIKEMVAHFGPVGMSLDGYYAIYLQLCRARGSYWLGTTDFTDPFFNPLHPLIMMGDQESYITKMSPSQTAIKVIGDRGEVYSTLGFIRDSSDTNTAYQDIGFEQANMMNYQYGMALQPSIEASLYGSLVDFRRYNSFGKLLMAFPAYQIIITNEGWFWSAGNQKLWDQFYTRTGVASIEVFHSKYQPGGTCSITFSNMYHHLTAYTQLEVMQHELARKHNQRMSGLIPFASSENETNSVGEAFSEHKRSLSDVWEDFVRKRVPKEVQQIWHNNHLKQLAMHTGARVQVRMGYGSNAASLPIVFNGTVVDAPVDEGFVQFNCVSDGYELEKPCPGNRLVKSGNAYAFGSTGALGIGKNPSSIVEEAVIGAAGWLELLTQGHWGRDFSAGIAHFGDINYKWDGVAPTIAPAEMQINIYGSNPTKLEQGITTLNNYNIFNALTNFDGNKNLISVEVHQPTPWKVMEVCRRACLDHIASAETFAMRSTVFFGKPWWPYHYSYDEKIIEAAEEFKLTGLSLEGLKEVEAANADMEQGKNPYNKPEVLKAWREKVVKASKLTGWPWQLEAITAGIARQILDETIIAVTPSAGIDGQYTDDLPSNHTRYKQYAIATGGYTVAKTDGSIYHAIVKGDEIVRLNKTKLDYDSTIKKYVDDNLVGQARLDSAVDPLPQAVAEYTSNTQQYNFPNDRIQNVYTLTSYLKWKTHMQAYIINSSINLLDNGIRADSSKVMTDAVGLHSFNQIINTKSMMTINYSVDTDIQPSERKTMQVDTGILVTAIQAPDRVGSQVAGKALEWATFGLIPVSDYVDKTPTTPAVENGVVAALVDSVKEMYQGWLTIMGQPTIKPRDFALLNDEHLNLRGPIFIKEVVHRMDPETGFITMVSPDCVVYPHKSVLGMQMVTSLSVGTLNRVGQLYKSRCGYAAVGALMRNRHSKQFNALIADDYSDAVRAYNRFAAEKKEILTSLTSDLRAKLTAAQLDIDDEITTAIKEATSDPDMPQADKDKIALELRAQADAKKADLAYVQDMLGGKAGSIPTTPESAERAARTLERLNKLGVEGKTLAAAEKNLLEMIARVSKEGAEDPVAARSLFAQLAGEFEYLDELSEKITAAKIDLIESVEKATLSRDQVIELNKILRDSGDQSNALRRYITKHKLEGTSIGERILNATADKIDDITNITGGMNEGWVLDASERRRQRQIASMWEALDPEVKLEFLGVPSHVKALKTEKDIIFHIKVVEEVLGKAGLDKIPELTDEAIKNLDAFKKLDSADVMDLKESLAKLRATLYSADLRIDKRALNQFFLTRANYLTAIGMTGMPEDLIKALYRAGIQDPLKIAMMPLAFMTKFVRGFNEGVKLGKSAKEIRKELQDLAVKMKKIKDEAVATLEATDEYKKAVAQVTKGEEALKAALDVDKPDKEAVDKLIEDLAGSRKSVDDMRLAKTAPIDADFEKEFMRISKLDEKLNTDKALVKSLFGQMFKPSSPLQDSIVKTFEEILDDQVVAELKFLEATGKPVKSGTISALMRMHPLLRFISPEAEMTDEIRELRKTIMKGRALKTATKMAALGKNIFNGAKLARFSSALTPIGLAKEAALFMLGGTLMEGFNARLRARQCVKIFPLMAGSVPYVAGIRGHQGAVVGDDPSWADEFIGHMKDAVPSNLALGFDFVFGYVSVGGIEIPDYASTDIDRRFINYIKGIDEESDSRSYE